MKPDREFSSLPGEPSDEVPDILATGSPPISTLFVSMAERHPDGADADYLRWHSLDHRPEQQRLSSVLTSLRVVSTAACRQARAVSSGTLDAVDHVMLYFFTEPGGLEGFSELSKALRAAGRSPFILNPVQRGTYQVDARQAAARARLGSDVLPWLPVTGLYLIIEQCPSIALQREHTAELVEIPGIAGVWSASATASEYSNSPIGQRLCCCFLDDDPLAVAARLGPVLNERWQVPGLLPLLAAPFYTVIPYQWDRYLP